MKERHQELLWPFTILKGKSFVVLDLETTGLFTEDEAPECNGSSYLRLNSDKYPAIIQVDGSPSP